MHEHGLVRRVVHDLEEFGNLRIGRPVGRRHADPEEVHPGGLDVARLLRRPVLLKVNHRLDAKRCEVCIVAALGLRAAEIVIVDLAEVVDSNVAERSGLRGCRGGRN